MSTRNRLKRARTEIDGEAAGTGGDSDELVSDLTRHPDLWFDDGSIVLNAETTLFRIHRTTLSAHSTVFSDMFGIPQPPDQGAIEGCTVVRLPDTALDLEFLLRALYNPFYFDDSEKFFEPGDGLASILRLSTKYNILQLRRKVISIYLSNFPSTLHGLDSRPRKKFPGSYVMSLIRLFRETNALECLPCAFYKCSFLSMSALLYCEDEVALSWEDKSACILGREQLLRAQESLSYSFIFSFVPPTNCTGGGLCAKRAKRIMYLFHHEQSSLTGVFALTNFTEWPLLDGLCSVCVKKAQSDHEIGRQQIWDVLPKYFGLVSWEEIEKAKRGWSDNHDAQESSS